jgi:tRNA A-37 threonylcarbamoyl transferase component Bud32
MDDSLVIFRATPGKTVVTTITTKTITTITTVITTITNKYGTKFHTETSTGSTSSETVDTKEVGEEPTLVISEEPKEEPVVEQEVVEEEAEEEIELEVPTTLDLSPYGVKWTMTPSTQNPCSYYPTVLQKFKKTANEIEIEKKRYKVNYAKILGIGSYSFVYECKEGNSRNLAIKMSKLTTIDAIQSYLAESICQMIVYSYSSLLPNGPYCPAIYDVAYNIDQKQYIVVSDKIPVTLHDYLAKTIPHKFTNRAQIEKASDKFVVAALKEISSMLDTLYNKYKFLHQDLKPENIVIDDSLLIYLIDFGYSYIQYNKLNSFGRIIRTSQNIDLFLLCKTLFSNRQSPYFFSSELRKKLWPHSLSSAALNEIEEFYKPSAIYALVSTMRV